MKKERFGLGGRQKSGALSTVPPGEALGSPRWRWVGSPVMGKPSHGASGVGRPLGNIFWVKTQREPKNEESEGLGGEQGGLPAAPCPHGDPFFLFQPRT